MGGIGVDRRIILKLILRYSVVKMTAVHCIGRASDSWLLLTRFHTGEMLRVLSARLEDSWFSWSLGGHECYDLNAGVGDLGTN